MPEEFKVPKFKNESEEAQWWDSQGKNIARAFEHAAADGRLGRGTAKRKGATPTTTIRLEAEDIARARAQAEKKGLRYQTYLKMLLRETLLKEEEKTACTGLQENHLKKEEKKGVRAAQQKRRAV
jgi:predicted DNA binding CopG/RHH family protein